MKKNNVQKVIDLLNDGFEIIKNETSFKEGSGANSEITLVKEKKSFTYKGSGEFYILCSNLKTVPLRNGHFDLIFIESAYFGVENNETIIQRPKFQNTNERLIISGYEFHEFSCHILPPDKKDTNKSYASVVVPMNMYENINFKYVDFKDSITILPKDSYDVVFHGFVIDYYFTDDIAVLMLRDSTIKMEIGKSSLSFKGISKTDGLEAVLALSDYDYKMNFEIILPESLKPNTEEKEFIVIVPVHNLILDQHMQIGPVTFYHSNDELDDQLIRQNDFGRKESVWNGNFARAKVKVKSKSVRTALIQGYKTISCALDILTLRANISFPILPLQSETKFSFSYLQQYAYVQIPEWGYCRDLSSPNHGHLLQQLNSINEKQLNLGGNPQKFLNGIEKHFEKLIVDDNLTQEEENIKQSLHWLRKAIQNSNRKDKLIELWISLEFLVSGIIPSFKITDHVLNMVEKEFGSSIKDSLEQVLNRAFSKKGLRNVLLQLKIPQNHIEVIIGYADSTPPIFSEEQEEEIKKILTQNGKLSENQLTALESGFKKIREINFRDKFNIIINDLGLKFSKVEMLAFNNSRDQRNDLFHGKSDVDVDDAELDKIISIIEKIIIFKLKQIKESDTYTIKDETKTKKMKKKKKSRGKIIL